MPNKTEILVFGLLSLYAVLMTEMYAHEKKAYAQFRTDTIAAGEAQNERTREVIKNHEQAAQEARNAYSRHIADIRSYYGVSNGASGSKLPSTAKAASRTDGLPAYGVLVEQCAETTEQLIDLQDFITATKE